MLSWGVEIHCHIAKFMPSLNTLSIEIQDA